MFNSPPKTASPSCSDDGGSVLAFAFVSVFLPANTTPPTDPSTSATPPDSATDIHRPEVRTTRLFDPAARALAVCDVNASGAIWTCDAAGLQHFNVRVDVETQASPGIEVQAAPLVLDIDGDKCTAGVEISLRHPTKPMSINWTAASFSVNGLAVQAIPGFARKITENLAQRPSNAIAGSLLREQVFPLDDSERPCLLMAEPAGSEPTELIFNVPVEAGGEITTLKVVERHTWDSVTSQEALAQIDLPDLGLRPAEPGVWFPWVAPLGLVVGAGACGGLAALVMLTPANAVHAMDDPSFAPTIYGTLISVGGLVGLAGGAFADYQNYEGTEKAKARVADWDQRAARFRALAATKAMPTQRF